jgi:hypothetical protein
MAIMWLTSLDAASKVSRNSAKSCETGKVHRAGECEYRRQWRILPRMAST